MGSGIELFFSYSHKDEPLRDELAKHLSLLQRQGVLSTWHDRQIAAGDEWAKQIDQHLDQADIILLLISPDFLASDYCYDIELTRAMERHHRGDAVVIPVILRPVDWQSAGFAALQALPKNAQPVITWEHQDEAFLDVARGIRRVAEQRAQALPSPRSDRADQQAPEQAAQEQIPEQVPAQAIAPLELPDGQVPLGSPFYVQRPPIEADCYEEVVKPSALIRIKAPRQVGKSSLLARILAHAENQGYRTVHLSFQEAEEDFFETLDGLLRWLCASIANALSLPAQLDRFWAEPLAKKQKCGNYLQDYIFPQVNAPWCWGWMKWTECFPMPRAPVNF
ncbi:MAG: AAA-like domain-containing protein [Cyanobacteria bacterium P01_B01_bin.77]